ncbi:hypothetical protein MKW92_010169, partial [Papaver armeniacum]
RVCGNPHAIIRKYGLMYCRQCFRSNAKEIGFIKLCTRAVSQLRLTEKNNKGGSFSTQLYFCYCCSLFLFVIVQSYFMNIIRFGVSTLAGDGPSSNVSLVSN